MHRSAPFLIIGHHRSGTNLPGLRVIQLVRDPRAVAASVLNVPESDELWKYSVTVTRHLEEQLGHPPGGGLVPFEYVTGRVEDLVAHPEDVLGQLMDFLDLEPTHGQRDFIADSQRPSLDGRYSSHRSRDAVLNSWRSRLTDAQPGWPPRRARRSSRAGPGTSPQPCSPAPPDAAGGASPVRRP
ncbi:hypothetical protein [Streptomyces sp. NPDC091371]|uniref:hypothetical protein n=1 Tax=Streptomyces sp. NPDC091371 TaxID=3155303 RepID=UPI003412EE9E